MPSAKAVITLFLSLPGQDRIVNVIDRVEKLSEDEVHVCLEKTVREFANRHRHLQETLRHHFDRVAVQSGSGLSHLTDQRKLLLGAFFTKEYSIESAALFNPSIVPHPDQQRLQPGEQRFVMSLRATGEGHISSIVFQTGTINKAGTISLDASTGYFTRLQKNAAARYSQSLIRQRIEGKALFDEKVLNRLPDSFTAQQAMEILAGSGSDSVPDSPERSSINRIEEILDTNYELEDSSGIPLNEKVIFPSARAEGMGMEDIRLVRFEDEGGICYYGTYTAYDGKQITTQLIETEDFNTFKARTLFGAAIADKGMALFPEKVNGKYVMVSRQGGEKINIMFSENLYRWDEYQLLLEPKYTWELLQLGNCGSPIKTDKGWLLLTHGVGMMRTYVISALLLDLNNPAQIIGRLDKPLIEADEEEREGYVPNVVYTCGLLRHGDTLMIPYAVSDSATGFITVSLNEMLNELLGDNPASAKT